MVDKKRRNGMILSIALFIPICLISNILLGVVLGIIGQIIFGAANGIFDTSESTIRADLARKYYPELKSFYYGIIISCWNLGISFGNYLGSVLFTSLAERNLNFNQIYFWLTILATSLLVASWLIFRMIEPKDYEFDFDKDGKKIVAPSDSKEDSDTFFS